MQLDGVFEYQRAVAGGGDLGQQGVGEGGLAGTGAAGDQYVHSWRFARSAAQSPPGRAVRMPSGHMLLEIQAADAQRERPGRARLAAR